MYFPFLFNIHPTLVRPNGPCLHRVPESQSLKANPKNSQPRLSAGLGPGLLSGGPLWSGLVHQQWSLLRGVPGGKSVKGRQAAVPRQPFPFPGDRTCSCSCSCSGRSSTGCRPSRSRGGTCRRWGCPGTARCRPGARWAPCPYHRGAVEMYGGQRERGPLHLPFPAIWVSLLLRAGSHLWALVCHGLTPGRPSLTPGCVG